MPPSAIMGMFLLCSAACACIMAVNCGTPAPDRKSTRLNSSHTDIYTLSLHDALPIYIASVTDATIGNNGNVSFVQCCVCLHNGCQLRYTGTRSEEHTSELQSH